MLIEFGKVKKKFMTQISVELMLLPWLTSWTIQIVRTYTYFYYWFYSLNDLVVNLS